MKTLPLLLAFAAILSFSFIGIHQIGNKHSESTQNILATFDGYEGGMYFFTDQENKAITLTADDILPIDGINLSEGDYIGKLFVLEMEIVENIAVIHADQVKEIRLGSP